MDTSTKLRLLARRGYGQGLGTFLASVHVHLPQGGRMRPEVKHLDPSSDPDIDSSLPPPPSIFPISTYCSRAAFLCLQ